MQDRRDVVRVGERPDGDELRQRVVDVQSAGLGVAQGGDERTVRLGRVDLLGLLDSEAGAADELLPAFRLRGPRERQVLGVQLAEALGGVPCRLDLSVRRDVGALVGSTPARTLCAV